MHAAVDPAELRLVVGSATFHAVLHPQQAPRTCAAILARLPLQHQLVHARWSGEAMWMPFGDERLDVPWEDPTSYPSPGQLLLFPGGISEMEILLPYGPTRFASKAGQLAGNHFATIVEAGAALAAVGRRVLYEGAQMVRIEAVR